MGTDSSKSTAQPDRGPERAVVKWSSFVAVGDSFTEGLDDRRDDGSYRGWADLVARALALRSADPAAFRYANLAIRGRKLPQIRDEQVPVAVGMSPDLVSVVGGVNDLLRPRFDADRTAGTLDEIVGLFRNAGCDVLLLIGASPAATSPRLAGTIHARLDALNEAVAQIAYARKCYALDLRGVHVFEDRSQWSRDRLHLSSLGHERMAAAFLETLGVGDSDWRTPPEASRGQNPAERAVADLRWAGQYLTPWLARRVMGRSSGDGLAPKRPALAPVVGPN